MRIREVTEARKNPEQNPKTSINSIIIDAVNTTTDTIAGIKNIFASFTSVDKLGINPGSRYNTPLGIYAYPAEYVVRVSGSSRPMTALPFAGDQPFVNLFSAAGNIVNLASMSEAEASAYNSKIAEYWAAISGKSWKESVDQVEELIVKSQSSSNFSRHAGGRFWYVTYRMSGLIAEQLNIEGPLAWNTLFRKIGIDGAVDTGIGIIHTSEKTQAVFFSISSVKKVRRHHNKHSSEPKEKAVARGAALKKILSPGVSDIDRVIAILKNDPALINKVPPERRLRVLEIAPDLVQKLGSPTDQELLTACTVDPNQLFLATLTNLTEKSALEIISQFDDSTKSSAAKMIMSVLNYANKLTPAIRNKLEKKQKPKGFGYEEY
jgi:hypothetical protein